MYNPGETCIEPRHAGQGVKFAKMKVDSMSGHNVDIAQSAVSNF